MRSYPASAIAPPALNQTIAPKQVWTHLSECQQQVVLQTLSNIAQSILDLATIHNTQEKSSNGSKY
jgi:hypothetical protein